MKEAADDVTSPLTREGCGGESLVAVHVHPHPPFLLPNPHINQTCLSEFPIAYTAKQLSIFPSSYLQNQHHDDPLPCHCSPPPPPTPPPATFPEQPQRGLAEVSSDTARVISEGVHENRGQAFNRRDQANWYQSLQSVSALPPPPSSPSTPPTPTTPDPHPACIQQTCPPAQFLSLFLCLQPQPQIAVVV